MENIKIILQKCEITIFLIANLYNQFIIEFYTINNKLIERLCTLQAC